MILQLAFVLTAIIIGARLGGIGLGVMGGVGLAILTFVFGLQPTAPPIWCDVVIAAVISAASCMQAGRWARLHGKISRKAATQKPFACHDPQPDCDVSVHFRCRNRARSLFGSGRLLQRLPLKQDTPGKTARYSCHCFTTGYYGKSYFCCYSCSVGIIGRIRYHSVRYFENNNPGYNHRCTGRCFFLHAGR